MTKYIPVKTPIGTLFGRDAIYLDGYQSNLSGYELVLTGEFNGALASNSQTEGFVPYRIIFHGVLAAKVTELDTFEALHSDTGWPETSFDQVEGSSWLRSLAGKMTEEHKCYVFQTYDWVFEVACLDFKLTVQDDNV